MVSAEDVDQAHELASEMKVTYADLVLENEEHKDLWDLEGATVEFKYDVEPTRPGPPSGTRSNTGCSAS